SDSAPPLPPVPSISPNSPKNSFRKPLMKRVQLDTLSQCLRKAITPDTRKQDATSKVLELFEPAPLFGKSSSTTGVKSRPVSVNTVSNLTPVSNSEGSTQARRQGYLRIPNEILDSILPGLQPTEAVVFLRLYRLSVGFNQTCCTVGTGGL